MVTAKAGAEDHWGPTSSATSRLFQRVLGGGSAVSSATLEILCGTERETAGPGRRAALPGPGAGVLWRGRPAVSGYRGGLGGGRTAGGHPPHLGGDDGGGGGDHGLHGDAIAAPPRTAAVAVC